MDHDIERDADSICHYTLRFANPYQALNNRGALDAGTALSLHVARHRCCAKQFLRSV